MKSSREGVGKADGRDLQFELFSKHTNNHFFASDKLNIAKCPNATIIPHSEFVKAKYEKHKKQFT